VKGSNLHGLILSEGFGVVKNRNVFAIQEPAATVQTDVKPNLEEIVRTEKHVGAG
jgi:enhancing lycopene biosynthesis protein 2